MNENKTAVLSANLPVRIDIIIKKNYPHLSRREIDMLCSSGRVLLSGKAVNKGRMLSAGENISVQLSETMREARLKQGGNFKPEIIFMDKHFCCVNKPENMHTVPLSYDENNALLNHLAGLISLPCTLDSPLNSGTLNRLDYETSGLVLVALNDQSYRDLRSQFSEMTVEKMYLARVHGRAPDYLCMDDEIREKKDNTRRAYSELFLLKKNQDYSWIALRLHTGVRHQLRISLSRRNLFISGDSKYGKNDQTTHLFLHSWSLEFTHPAEKKRIILCAPLPAYWDFPAD